MVEWQEIDRNNDDAFEYGNIILFSPRPKHDVMKYSNFGTAVSLEDTNTALVGSSNFTPPIKPLSLPLT